MNSIRSRAPLRRFVTLTLLCAVGCTGAAPVQFGDDPRYDTPTVPKGGLDTPAVAVAPFLDGVFPERTPNSPGGSEWTIVPAFPNLDLEGTLVIASNPDDDRLYVGSQDGLVIAFENRSDVTTTETFLDLRDRLAVVWEGGLLGLAFHPSFGDPTSADGKAFYVYYTSHCPLDGARAAPDLTACDDSYPRTATSGFFNTYLRLSRFEVLDGTVIGDPSTEQVLVNVRLYNSSHRGGGMAFRNDGFLYLAIGDQRRYETAQDIVDTFEGGLFRFAVDVTDNGDGTWTCPANTHQPRRTFDTADEISGRHYCIPDDNPWLDPAGGVYEEYCAVGFRNPHRLAVDPTTGRIWEGEVGHSQREEVNVLECGNNYGWPFREGLIEGVRPEPPSFLGILTDPVIDFTRAEARSIIGGYVYRGTKFPELYGRYLAGDYVTNQVWAITLDETTMTATKVFLAHFGPGNLATWGQDNDGEVFLGDIFSTGPLYTLDRIGVLVPDAPALLSDTGAFSNTPLLIPSAAWVPYALNQPFWSDGAVKSRFVAVPTDGVRDSAPEQIAFSSSMDWSFPTGTVLMKHFELPVDEADPSVTTRLETRFMVLGDDGAWYGLTYRWHANQLDADLLTSEETGDYTIKLLGGGTRDQSWYFPSRLDCLSCHRQATGGALGPRTHQLNGDFTYPSTGRTDNQIRSWNDLGMFSPPVDDASISTFLGSPALGDVTAPLQDRARSWLDANCSYCHRPGGADAGFDLRFTTPFVDQSLLWTPVRDDLGDPETVVIYPGDPILSSVWQRSLAIGAIAMPPLAKALPDQPAVDLLAEWIERIDPVPVANSPPLLTNPGEQDAQPGQPISLDLIATDDDGDALYFDAVGLPDGLSLDHDTGAISGTTAALGTQTVIVSASDGPAVSVVSFGWNVSVSSCGDGVQDDGEECDDGNLTDDDGCTSGCVVEFCGDGVVNNGGAETCEPPDTEVCTDACISRTAQCGDGFLTEPEECEDSNVVDGDGCTSGCVVEFCGDGVVNNGGAETCEPPDTEVCTDACVSRTAQCGDGFLTEPEECEDSNVVDGDGCTSACVVEFCGDGVVNDNGSEACEPPGTASCTDTCATRAAQCGDGFLTPPEQCEDGNVVNGDGCTSACVAEFCGDGVINDGGTETCEPPGTALCTTSCQIRVAQCGDGFLTPPEQCEDGNVLNGDGCSSGCSAEFCGDGVVNNDGAEACEPPGTAVCTASCAARVADCGDGFLTPPEECEDGNVSNGDGCSSGCALEFCGDGVINNNGTEACEPPGTASCTDACATRTAQCGDGFLTPPEECEDGNVSNGDGCTSGCIAEFCGDGIVNDNGNEACEPPGTASCTDTCAARTAQCGDGFLTPPEQCEDGNVSNGDGCTSGCVVEFCGDGIVNDNGNEACEPPETASCTDTCAARTAQCGDGFLTPPEQCEDGNVSNGDGCTSGCVVEFCGDGVVNDNGSESCEPPGTASCTDTCAARTAQCGDGFLTPPEQCEDGNVSNGDGCTSGCVVEFCGDGVVNDNGSEVCEPPGTASCTDTCAARTAQCGDGFLTPPEQCEDGNVLNGDGCTSGCVVEFCGDGVVNDNGSEVCEPPGTASCTSSCATRTAQCGDGFLTPPEQCEDGNLDSGDGCSAACTVEVPSACGDGTTDPGEECDDGNLVNDDGCTSSCSLEFCGDGVINNGGSEACEPPGTALCGDNCEARTAVCGDGFQTPPEQCEDGNLTNGDGCTSSCTMEFCGDGVINDNGAEQCEPPVTASCTDACTMRTAQCGDGFLTPPEQCEDGNTVGGDGCSSGCEVEFCGDGVINNNGAEACEPPGTSLCTNECTIRLAQCGDGLLTPPEECEDGNVIDGDGCTSSCAVETCGDGVINNNGTEACEPPGTALCNDSCAPRTAQCGDGFLTPPEQCEDGNFAGGDGCTSGCALEFCGDGVVNNDGAEACEPPGTALCTESCTIRSSICGDGLLTPPELCEDGNLIDGDGCTSSCVPEICGDGVVNNSGAEVCEPPGTASCNDGCTIRVPSCGDGFLTSPEQCEDGNVLGGDGCTSSCLLEFCGDGVVNNDGTEACEPPSTALCTASCTAREARCGDGLMTPPEQCEDGNVVDGDGCTSACALEFCGDGVVNNDGAEACEPPGTGVCTDGCTLRSSMCGDGLLTPPEECDDSNLSNGDGCTSGCTLEYCGDGVVNNGGAETCEPPGTESCTDGCTARAPACGDGFLTPPEECEDSNLVDGDGCTSDCTGEYCGDGIVNNNGAEACEPPGTATCTDNCAARAPGCGDGMTDDGEACDDGNVEDGDGCSAACELESPATPDGGIPDGGIPDGGVADGGTPDGSTNGGNLVGGCNVQRGRAPIDLAALLGLLAVTSVLRRRRV